jgi:hypothetical protein
LGSWMKFYDSIRLFPTVITSSDQIRPRCFEMKVQKASALGAFNNPTIRHGESL